MSAWTKTIPAARTFICRSGDDCADCGRMHSERHLHGAREQVQAYLPAIRTAAFELNKLPDAVLVDVHDNQQHVRVSKAGGGLKIEVQSPDEHVDVWVPLRAAYDTASSLESRFRDGK